MSYIKHSNEKLYCAIVNIIKKEDRYVYEKQKTYNNFSSNNCFIAYSIYCHAIYK